MGSTSPCRTASPTCRCTARGKSKPKSARRNSSTPRSSTEKLRWRLGFLLKIIVLLCKIEVQIDVKFLIEWNVANIQRELISGLYLRIEHEILFKTMLIFSWNNFIIICKKSTISTKIDYLTISDEGHLLPWPWIDYCSANHSAGEFQGESDPAGDCRGARSWMRTTHQALSGWTSIYKRWQKQGWNGIEILKVEVGIVSPNFRSRNCLIPGLLFWTKKLMIEKDEGSPILYSIQVESRRPLNFPSFSPSFRKQSSGRKNLSCSHRRRFQCRRSKSNMVWTFSPTIFMNHINSLHKTLNFSFFLLKMLSWSDF